MKLKTLPNGRKAIWLFGNKVKLTLNSYYDFSIQGNILVDEIMWLNIGTLEIKFRNFKEVK